MREGILLVEIPMLVFLVRLWRTRQVRLRNARAGGSASAAEWWPLCTIAISKVNDPK